MKRMTMLALLSLGILLSGFGWAMAEGDVDLVPAYDAKQHIDMSPMPLPDITKKSLKNGMTVYYIPSHELPVASVQINMPGAGLYCPLDKAGLVDFMSGLLDQGTETRSAQDIAATMDFIGGSLSVSSGYNACNVGMDVLTRDLETGLEIMADVIMNPTFPEAEIERARQQWMSGLMMEKDEPSAIADKVWTRFVYGADHPYGLPQNGTMESVQSFTRQDLVDLQNVLLTPKGAVMVVSGDIEPKKAHKLINKYFGDWKGNDLPAVAHPDPTEKPGGKILVVDKPDAVQTQIRMGYILAPKNMNHENYYAFNLMNYLFGGGGFSSHLMLRVRNELGLTYGAYSGLDYRRQKGAYTMDTYTGTENTGLMVEEMLGVMNNVRAEGFNNDELTDAKAYIIGTYVMGFETPAQVGGKFITTILYELGVPEDYIANFRKNYGSVTLDEVNAAAVKYLQPENIRIVLVGVADDIIPQVEKFGEVQRISMDEYETF